MLYVLVDINSFFRHLFLHESCALRRLVNKQYTHSGYSILMVSQRKTLDERKQLINDFIMGSE